MTPRAVPKKKKKKRPSAEMLAGAHRSHVSDSRYSQAFPTFVMILTWKSLFYVSFLHLCVVGSQK